MINSLFSLFFLINYYSIPVEEKRDRIIIEIYDQIGQLKKADNIVWTKMHYTGSKRTWNSAKPSVSSSLFKWSIPISQPIILSKLDIRKNSGLSVVVEPGDSIKILHEPGKTEYAGKGSEKFRFISEIQQALLNDPLPGTKYYFDSLKTVNQFYTYNSILSKKLENLYKIREKYRDSISDEILDYMYKLNTARIEHQRIKLFRIMYKSGSDNLKMSPQEYCKLYDSIIATPINNEYLKFPLNATNAPFLYDYIKLAVYRDLNFDSSVTDQVDKTLDRKILYYEKARNMLSGLNFQNYMAYFLTSAGVKTYFAEPQMEKILKAFYALPGYPEHKEIVKKYERQIIAFNQKTGGKIPTTTFYDENDERHSLQSLAGKPVMICFWDPSAENTQTFRRLRQIIEKVPESSDFAFLFVATGNIEKWSQKFKSTGIQSKNVKNLYYGTRENLDAIYKALGIVELPTIVLLDRAGKYKEHHVQSITTDNGKNLEELISNQMALLNDGPYLIYNNDSIISWKTIQSQPELKTTSRNSVENLFSGTDLIEKSIPIKIKKHVATEPAIYNTKAKILVLSDIEGNFDHFRKLLQANGVIDSDFNWVFGDSHLVFAGDMFDRGKQVTECLWLVYTLEEKAQKAGGYIHFILGNHEIMNLSGDLRYVDPKYIQNAASYKLQYGKLYDEKSELGRWLRTKNIIEKINDLLFVHAGISREVTNIPISLEQINSVAKRYYSKLDSAKTSDDPTIRSLYNSSSSPFWFRGYYKKDARKVDMQLVDSSLLKFGVSRIITGHTIVSDTISVHYEGKVINVDTRHQEGKSEALLIEGSKFYRVNANGSKKVLLLNESRHK